MTMKQMTMTSTQTVNGDTDSSVMTTPVKWEFSNDAVTLTYDEQGDMRGTTTAVTVAGDTVVIQRRGLTQTRMEFTAKKRCSFDYETAAGLLKLSTVTETADAAFTADGGTLTLRYRLYADGGLISKNEIVMEIV